MRPLPFNDKFIAIECKFVITCMYEGYNHCEKLHLILLCEMLSAKKKNIVSETFSF